MKTLETKRLILRPFELDDLDDFYEYCSLSTVGPNAGWKVHESKEESLKILEGFLEKKDVLALFHKEDKKVIGSIGLHQRVDLEGNEHYEIGYVLSTPYEGQGFMTEAVKCMIRHAFMDLKLERLIVYHFLENDKSRRVIEKCGFRFVKNTLYQSANFGLKESRYYELFRDEYINMEENI